MLRASILNSKISAYTYIFGNYDFNTTPIEPADKRLVGHYKPDQRLTWYLNGESVWYVIPSMKHYFCVQCYYPRTNQVHDCDTFTFMPHEYPFLEVNLEYFLNKRQMISSNSLVRHLPLRKFR